MPPESDAPWRLAVPLAAATAFAILDWVAVGAGGARGGALERVAKPATMLSLLAAAVLAPVATPGAAAARPWLLAGLAASLAGDLLLLPPGRFVPGLAAFLVGHVAYLVAFLWQPGDAAWLVAALLAAAAVALTLGRVLVAAATRLGLGAPVALYLAGILAMAVAATRTGQPAAVAGAWLFVASDALLGWGRLRDPRPGLARAPGRCHGVGVMASYHAAQALIVVALCGPSA